jgi:N-acetylglutamate synthase-like GNAT family acetyltransferase
VAERPDRPEVRVRPATAADVDAVRDLTLAAYGHYVDRIGRRPAPMDADHGREVRDGQVSVAEADGEVVGLVVLVEADDHLLVENVAVAPTRQGGGVGALLLRHAEARARSAGLPEVRLYTHEAMVENLAYYARHGFVETHRRTEDGFRRVFLTKVLAGDDAAREDGRKSDT